MSNIKKLLEVRKERKRRQPLFRRQGYGIYHRIGDEWRKPRGRHSKLKHQSAGHSKKVKPGFRTDRRVRGLDMSGLIPVVIHSPNHVSMLDKSKHGAIIGGNVGNRKRILLLNELKKHGITVLNLKDNHHTKIQDKFNKRKQEKASISSQESKKGKKEHKKEEKEMSAEEKEAHEKKEKDKVLTKGQK